MHLDNKSNEKNMCVKPELYPLLKQGKNRHDLQNTVQITTLRKTHTIQSAFQRDCIYCGVLTQHRTSQQVGQLLHGGAFETVDIFRKMFFEAAGFLAMTNGIVTGPESSHSVATVSREIAGS